MHINRLIALAACSLHSMGGFSYHPNYASATLQPRSMGNSKPSDKTNDNIISWTEEHARQISKLHLLDEENATRTDLSSTNRASPSQTAAFNSTTLANVISSRNLSYRKPVTFYAMGDAPYSSGDRDRLPGQIRGIPSDSEFIVHLGDMKGVDKCKSDGPYELVSDAFLEFSTAPVFLTPGDNDYYDCDNWGMGWERWTNYFLRFHDNFDKGWSVKHQPGREENFAFRRRGVLFIGVHTVGAGSGIKDKGDWETLMKDNLKWTREQLSMSHKVAVILTHARPTSAHDTYIDGLLELAKESGKSFLYMHGDTHRWSKDRSFDASNILRVAVDQGGIADPVQVTIDLNGEEPDISFKRRSLTKRFLRVEEQR